MSKRGADEAVAAEDFLVTPMAAEGVPDVVAHATGLVHPQVQGAQQQPGMVHQQDALAETPTGSAQKKQRTWERHRWSFQNDLALFNQVGRPSLSLSAITDTERAVCSTRSRAQAERRHRARNTADLSAIEVERLDHRTIRGSIP